MLYIPITELVPIFAQILSIRIIIKDKNSLNRTASTRYQQKDIDETSNSRRAGTTGQLVDDYVTETTTFIREEDFVLLSGLISGRSTFDNRNSQKSSKDSKNSKGFRK